MNVFELRNNLIRDYRRFVESFVRIRDDRIAEHVRARLDEGALWPDPLVQLNPTFAPGQPLERLVEEGLLHPETLRIFRLKDRPDQPLLKLHRHQEEAIRTAARRENYVVTTGTGSGKSLTYIIPIVDHVLRHGSGRGIQAIVVYPMNALANSQWGSCTSSSTRATPMAKARCVSHGTRGRRTKPSGPRFSPGPRTSCSRTTSCSTSSSLGPAIRTSSTRPGGSSSWCSTVLHTYRGRQGADVALLVRRLRERLEAHEVVCVGTSATMSSEGGPEERKRTVAQVASRIFGREVRPENVIGETLQRTTRPYDFSDPQVRSRLRERVRAASQGAEAAWPLDFAAFAEDPLASWVEQTLGVREEGGAGAPDPTPSDRAGGRGGRAGRAGRAAAGGLPAGAGGMPAGRVPPHQPRQRPAGLRLPAAPVHQPRRYRLRLAGRA